MFKCINNNKLQEGLLKNVERPFFVFIFQYVMRKLKKTKSDFKEGENPPPYVNLLRISR